MSQLRDNTDKLIRPYETQSIGAGYMFAFGNMVNDCPYEAEFENVFNWEEVHLHLRCRSKGYNLYAPHKNLVFHNWDRTYRPLFFGDNMRGNTEKAKES